MESLRHLALVFVGGGLGASARVALAELVERRWGESFPFVGVLAVNLLGCLLIGVAAESLRATGVRLAVIGGLLGGFTTYSAYALLTVQLGTDGRYGVAAAQVLAHLLGGIAAAALGVAAARQFGWTDWWT